MPRSRPHPPKQKPVPPIYVTTGFANTGDSGAPPIDRIDDALDVWADGLPTIVALGIGYQGFQKLRHLLHEAVK